MNNRHYREPSRLVKETLNLRKKIITLNSDVKKTQEEIKKHIYKMILLKKHNPNFFDKFSKNNHKQIPNHIDKTKNLKNIEVKTKDNYYNKIDFKNNQIQKEIKKSVPEPEKNETFWFTDAEETWIPLTEEEKKQKEKSIQHQDKNISFYELIHKKG
ncbi:MAG: hypothetical protein HDR31_00120 [Mycoplasma sp.]|nr:hypothetical protein [Mycoplasma sp.]